MWTGDGEELAREVEKIAVPQGGEQGVFGVVKR